MKTCAAGQIFYEKKCATGKTYETKCAAGRIFRLSPNGYSVLLIWCVIYFHTNHSSESSFLH